MDILANSIYSKYSFAFPQKKMLVFRLSNYDMNAIEGIWYFSKL